MGCSKDEEPTAIINSGKFTINGITYLLSDAYYVDYGSNGNGSFDIDITLSSTSLENISADIKDLNIIRLDLNTSTDGKLETGTYTYGNDREAMIMVSGLVGGDVSLSNQGVLTGPILYNLKDGAVTVAASDSIYTIGFSLSGKSVGGLDLTANGSYTGTLREVTP